MTSLGKLVRFKDIIKNLPTILSSLPEEIPLDLPIFPSFRPFSQSTTKRKNHSLNKFKSNIKLQVNPTEMWAR